MDIFFDQQIFVSQEQGGISRYFTELARGLAHAGSRPYIFGGLTANTYLGNLQPSAGVQTRFRHRRDRLRINTWVARMSRLWARWNFAQLRRRSKCLVYHATNYAVDPWIARRADAACLTVFDMIGELLGDEPSRARSWTAKGQGLRLVDGVLCISEQTKRDFAKLFPECAARAQVTLLASSLAAPGPADLAAASQRAPYLLFVGKRAGYKNGLVALRAFVHLARTHKTVSLVCFGGERLSAEEDALVRGEGLCDRVLTIRGDDALLAAFYVKSIALLYPSRYEGFGLPVLEAMQLGCPVVTTRCASLPEVAGQAALYVDPDDLTGWVEVAARLLQNEAWRQEWIAAGKVRAQRFSWQATARETLAAYQQLLHSRTAQTGTGMGPTIQAFSGVSRS